MPSDDKTYPDGKPQPSGSRESEACGNNRPGEQMTSAELIWKTGFAPLMSKKALDALLAACETDDKRLTQGSTTTPPPLMCVQDWQCEAACSLGYCGWADDDFASTVGEVEEFFAVSCFRADELLGEPAACRWFLNWFDDTPRAEMLSTLASWIRDELDSRAAPAPIPAAPLAIEREYAFN